MQKAAVIINFVGDFRFSEILQKKKSKKNT